MYIQLNCSDYKQNQHPLFKKIRAGISAIARDNKWKFAVIRVELCDKFLNKKKMFNCVAVSSWALDLNQYCFILLKFVEKTCRLRNVKINHIIFHDACRVLLSVYQHFTYKCSSATLVVILFDCRIILRHVASYNHANRTLI